MRIRIAIGLWLLGALVSPAMSAEIATDELTPRWECDFPRGGVRVFEHAGFIQWRFPDETASFAVQDGYVYTLEMHKLWDPNRKCALIYRAPVDAWLPQTVHSFREIVLDPEGSWPQVETILATFSDIEECPARAAIAAEKTTRPFAEARAKSRCRTLEVSRLNRRGIVVNYFEPKSKVTSSLSGANSRLMVLFDDQILSAD